MNRTLEQSFQVRFHYPVEFTTHLFDSTNALFARTVGRQGSASKVLVVMDAGLVDAHPDLPAVLAGYCQAHQIRLVAPPMVLPGGEAVKQDPAHVTMVHNAISHHGIDRHSFVVVVGGGALIDLVGYAAATAHRGVRLIRVPTTVLSQNDSAVGVKNSVNAYGKKNWLGTFAPPYAVLNDFALLESLEDRDWLGGLSEAVKVALLKDEVFFAFLETHADALRARNLHSMEHAVYRCAELHLEHIATSGDAFEQGSSRPLDFGHWAAHKLEALTGYSLRHGEAVAMGIALDSTYAHLRGWLPEPEWLRIVTLFNRLGLAVFHPVMLEALEDVTDPSSLLHGLQEFREHLGGQLTIMLLSGIGSGKEVHEMDLDLVVRSVQRLSSLQSCHDPASAPPIQTLEETVWTPTATPVL